MQRGPDSPWPTTRLSEKKTETERESVFTNKATRRKKTIFTNKKPQLLTYGDFQRIKRKQYFNLLPCKNLFKVKRRSSSSLPTISVQYKVNANSFLHNPYIHKKYAAEGLQNFAVNVFWDVIPCGVHRSTLMTEVRSSSEISTHIHQTTRLHIQDKSNISQRSLWNFK